MIDRDGRGHVAATALIVAVGGLLFLLLSSCISGRQGKCARLQAELPGVDSISWDNGYTSSGSSWYGALTNAALHGDDPSREAVAASLRDRALDFRRLLRTVDDEDRWAFEHLHALAVDPDEGKRRVAEPKTLEARQVLSGIIIDCGWAP